MGDDPGFALLFEDFLGRRDYDRAFALKLRGRAADPRTPWPIRRAATLMLERTLLLGDDFRFWLRELGIDTHDEASLRNRLARNARVHERLGRTDAAIADFLHLASRDCRLTLARWLFTAQEVFARVDEQVQRAHGVRCSPEYDHPFVAMEAADSVRMLPPLERDLITRLGHKAVTRWVAPQTSDEINSLVEHPLGTVVLTVKPPGSDQEIEIKRAGVRGPFVLDVVYDREGYVIPPSHHLQGGSMEAHLTVETSNSSIMSRLYRFAHGETAPMSRTIHLANVFNMPSPKGEVDILDYFTDPEVFGERYQRMRRHLGHATGELARLSNRKRTEKVNDLGLTIEFLGLTQPAQAIQLGTTSYRLERLGMYFAAGGGERYFAQRKVEPTRDDLRRFADELLDEILCVYEPPQVPFRSWRTYLDAAFAVRANRERAARNYIEILAQIGRFWGTLLAARGHTHGETFVTRNCGLRAVFEHGQWRIRIIFMDHDSLAFAARYERTYSPRASVYAATRDARFILGRFYGDQRPQRGELDVLREIYRPTKTTERKGWQALRESMRPAYDATQHAMQHNPQVRRMFEHDFITRLTDWDDSIRTWLTSPRRWKNELTIKLQQRGYGPRTVEQMVQTIVRQKHFLTKMKFLYAPPG